MTGPFERAYRTHIGDDWSWETTETTFRVAPDARMRQRHWHTKMSRSGEPHRFVRFDDPLRWDGFRFVRVSHAGEIIALKPNEVAELRGVVDAALSAIGEEALCEEIRRALEAGFLEPEC